MVKAIRGATTVRKNSSQDIIEETKILLETIIRENKVQIENIISIIFTATKDLNSEFPAKAAREIGWTDIPLMCSNEIDVKGSLKKCIRVLIHINSGDSSKKYKHIYLNGACILRPDLCD